MLHTLAHEDVTELRFTTRRSRSMGFRVSAFVVRGVLAERMRAPKPIGFYRRYTWGSPAPVGAFAPFSLPALLTCILTPGHSDDHHIVWDSETGTVFGGDLFIGVKVRISHQTETPRALVQSLRLVTALKPARYFDAHKGLLATPVALLIAKADWIARTIESLDALIAEGLDDATIAGRVLGRDWWNRTFTGGDYTMANFVHCVRASASIAPQMNTD